MKKISDVNCALINVNMGKFSRKLYCQLTGQRQWYSPLIVLITAEQASEAAAVALL